MAGIFLAKVAAASAHAAAKKSSILVIWGDDIGIFNVGAYNTGMMGYKTPNIDRIAKEGAVFTDWYGQQSCTVGRAAFITGQPPIRTGLTKVGFCEIFLPAGLSILTRLALAVPRGVPAPADRCHTRLAQAAAVGNEHG